MIRKLIEKLYYKAFPDRVHDHEIANMPISEPQVITYDIVPVKLVQLVDERYIPDSSHEWYEFMHRELTRKIAEEIGKYVRVETKKDYRSGYTEYRAELEVVDRR